MESSDTIPFEGEGLASNPRKKILGPPVSPWSRRPCDCMEETRDTMLNMEYKQK